jgi:hypothetical protein
LRRLDITTCRQAPVISNAIDAKAKLMKTKKTWTKPKLMVLRAGRAEKGPTNNLSDGGTNRS